ncbi:MAG: hypothetical protein RLZZ524_1236, partial [Pseudomonadota bacterium]
YRVASRVKDIIAGRNTSNGIAPLDAGSKVPVANIPALSYLPSTGGTVSGATTFSSTVAITGAATMSSTLQVASNVTVTSGWIQTSANYINANLNGQSSYSTAALRSTSTTGNAGVALHASGSSAAYIQHPRGGNGIEVYDASNAWADIKSRDVTSNGNVYTSGIVYGGTTNTAACYIGTDATYSYHSFDTGDSLRYNRSANTLETLIGSTSYITESASGIYPSTDNTLGCGVASNRWSVVYAVNGTIQTSDKRRKDDLGPLGEVGSIIDALRPVAFAWKASGEHDVGFYAQDVAPLIPEAVMVGDDEIDWGLKPDRLIPFLVREIQSLRRRLAALESAR